MGDEYVGGRITYTTRELIDALEARVLAMERVHSQMDKRLDTLDRSIARLADVLDKTLPSIQDFMDQMNVKEQVESALDDRNLRGTIGWDKMVMAILSMALIVI